MEDGILNKDNYAEVLWQEDENDDDSDVSNDDRYDENGNMIR